MNAGATLNLDDLTIADGSAPGESIGGGILNDGTLTVTNSTFSDNFADEGGGIFNQSGTLTVTNSTFSGNSAPAYGGGICDHGRTLTVIANSTFSKNSAGFDGGGILTGGTLTVTNSTFSGNSSADAYLSGGGGGIGNIGTLAVTNSTFSKNSAKNGGGGISSTGTASVTNSTFAGNSASTSASASSFAGGGGILTGGTLTVSNSTFLANGAPSGSGGGIENYNGSATVSNSILTKSPGGNCGVFNVIVGNGGYNISNDGTCGFGRSTGANGRTIGDNVTPLLKVLAHNGGPTETIALQPKSPAIDAIPIDLCPATDQRGFPRPDPASPPETACDIGAFESGSHSKTSD